MRRSLATLMVATLALPLAACGRDEGEPIPSRQADALVSVLGTAKRQADAGSCQTLLRDTIPSLQTRAEKLPRSVGEDVRETIIDGINRLRDLAEDQCAPDEQPTPTEDTTESTETTTEAPTTETTETTPETTETTTEETTPPDTETTPPDTNTETTPTPPTDPGDGGGSTIPGDPGGGVTPRTDGGDGE